MHVHVYVLYIKIYIFTHACIYKCGKDGREESLAEIYNRSQYKMNSRNFSTICILFLNNILQKLQMSLSLKEFKQKYKTQVTT